MGTLIHANLNFGDIVQLESVIGGRHRYRVQLLGLLQDVTVMVTAPDVAGHGATIVEGESLIVRIFTGDEALAFRAGVTRVCRHPFGYLHLTYPAEVTKALVRNARRAKQRLPAQVKGVAPEAVPVQIEDISIEGAQLEARAELGAIGDTVTISATLPIERIGERSVSLPAMLKNMKLQAAEVGAPLYRYGVRFQDLPGDADLVLTAYVYLQLDLQLLGESSG